MGPSIISHNILWSDRLRNSTSAGSSIETDYKITTSGGSSFKYTIRLPRIWEVAPFWWTSYRNLNTHLDDFTFSLGKQDHHTDTQRYNNDEKTHCRDRNHDPEIPGLPWHILYWNISNIEILTNIRWAHAEYKFCLHRSWIDGPKISLYTNREYKLLGVHIIRTLDKKNYLQGEVKYPRLPSIVLNYTPWSAKPLLSATDGEIISERWAGFDFSTNTNSMLHLCYMHKS